MTARFFKLRSTSKRARHCPLSINSLFAMQYTKALLHER
jgi:hypothetical protein